MNTRKNKSNLVGTTWCEKLQKWRAKIQYDYKTIHLGYYLTQEEAHEKYKEKYMELYGKEYLSERNGSVCYYHNCFRRVNLFNKILKE